MKLINPLPYLQLPRRWELLEQAANQAEVDPAEFVERVDDACLHIDGLLASIRSGGAGQFEVLYGLSGSGKTTFVSTLPRFFEDVDVTRIDSSTKISDIAELMRSTSSLNKANRIYLIVKRDNPTDQDLLDAEKAFSEFVDFFRTSEGRALVLWTVTDREAATSLAASAWAKGRDSVCNIKTRGLYEFAGLPKDKFPKVADATAKSLTGDGIDAFGIDEALSHALVKNCETISDYFLALTQKAEELRIKTWSVLKEKTRPRLWIVLPGDTVKDVEATVRALTQGNRGRIDIDLMQEFIDTSGETTLYVKEWKTRRSAFPHLVRAIDLRLFALPPNAALAAVRAYGESSVKATLNQQSSVAAAARKTLRSTRLYKELVTELGGSVEKYAGPRGVKADTEDEYRRLQRQANKTDKPLNKALGKAIEDALREDGFINAVRFEVKNIATGSLQPDIAIDISKEDVICIEPTWRSTGKGISGELDNRQNTLAEAHIKQYIMNKALDYVKALSI